MRCAQAWAQGLSVLETETRDQACRHAPRLQVASLDI